MSTATRAATARPSTPRTTSRPASRPASRRRPTLTEVPALTPAVAGNGMFALVVVALLLGGMVVLLVLNTSLAQGAFELGALSHTQSELGVQEQKLLQNVAQQEAPESLQKRAADLGMVPVTAPVFLRLADGAVLGTPTPAQRVRGAGLPATGLTGPAPTGAAGATGATGATGAAGAKGAVTTKPVSGDAAVADPAPATDAAVPDSSTPGKTPSGRQVVGAHQ